jgi:hypothetical protein
MSDLALHWSPKYDNIEHLKRRFRDQLDKLLDEKVSRMGKNLTGKKVTAQFLRCTPFLSSKH